jgi:CBS domain-containing protein
VNRRKAMNEVTVNDVMTHLVATLRPEDKIADAAKRLLTNRISGAPVVEGGRLVGVISEADLVKAFSHPARRRLSVAPYPLMFLLNSDVPGTEQSQRVRDVMTTKVITVSPDASIGEAAHLIDRHGIRRLPVVDQDNFVVGVVARADLVRVMADAARSPESALVAGVAR